MANDFQYYCYKDGCEERFRDLVDATQHLYLIHDVKRTGDTVNCVKIHEHNVICVTKFKSLAAMRKHVKSGKCSLRDEVILLHQDIIDDQLSYDADSSVDGVDDSQSTTSINFMPDFSGLAIDSGTTEEIDALTSSIPGFIDNFLDELVISNLPHAVVSNIIKFSQELIFKTMSISVQTVNGMTSVHDVQSTLRSTTESMISYFNNMDSRYKRKIRCKRGPHYISPQSINLHDKVSFQYVSILKTLEQIFSNEGVRNEYFSYNNNHLCSDGVYERFCCGQNYQNNALFQKNPNSIQIQLFYDDVQLTSPLKTKPYKVSAIYFIIRNLPSNFVSKLDNMYLVSLCDSRMVNEHGYNVVLRYLVNDIKILETVGIHIDNDENTILKGTLVQVSFDNLGGNEIFGFSKSFNATYYCRICTLTKQKCQTMKIESIESIRTKQHYYEQIKEINDFHEANPTAEYKDIVRTLGILNYSVLNDLDFYHTIENRSQDIMHDIYEGAMPFILKHFFESVINEGIIDEMEIQRRIKSFDYGKLEKKNTPSILFVKKSNLNQNASQMHCLFKHMPFIFGYLLITENNLHKRYVNKVWSIIEYMLKINQITSSTVIKENDLNNLVQFVEKCLADIKACFDVKFIPKLHFLTHYADTVRKMGPLVHMQMMRGDAKHQPMVQYAKRSKNYTNICSTLAEKHQEILASKWNRNTTYVDNIQISKKKLQVVDKNGILQKEFEKYSLFLISRIGAEHFPEVIRRNFMIYNSFYFKKGLFVMYCDAMHRIEAILEYDNSKILLCTKFDTVKFYPFANSFEVKESTGESFIEFENLLCKRSFESKMLFNRTHIIADNLDMFPVYGHCPSA